MTTTTGTIEHTTRISARRRYARAAAYAVGPFFICSILLNSWASIDFLHTYGWQFSGGKSVPWPSVLAHGPYGWLQVASFALAGLLVLVFCDSLRPALPRRRIARVGSWLTTLIGVALLASAAPIDDAMLAGNGPTTWHGVIHMLAFLLLMLTTILGPVVLGLGLRRSTPWRPFAILSPAAAAAMVAALVLAPHGQGGFVIYLTILFAWTAGLATRLRP